MKPQRQIALLRGINVGTAKRVSMADLRGLLESLGYDGVRTLLNSGNAVFTSSESAAASAARIERGMAAELKVSARAIVISASELAAIVAANPLLKIADNPALLLVGVLSSKRDRTLVEPLLKEDWSPEALALGERAAYLWCPRGTQAGDLWKEFQRRLKDAATTRNWATMLKLHELARAAG